MIINGNSLEVLKTYPDNSIDSVVTDPPYGLSFMGKKWDYDVPSTELWKEVFRVLKPGGHLLAFAGTRTQHRMAVNIEDAGFEIRDMIAWVYGSGFPKSLNIGKAVDKLQGNERELVDVIKKKPSATGNLTSYGYRESYEGKTTMDITKGNSPYEGWGTALKPALEPITVARKPIKGSVAQNVLEHGTGGLNIDGCRVGTTDEMKVTKHRAGTAMAPGGASRKNGETIIVPSPLGRFPANLIHDGSDEVVGLFPDTKGSATPRTNSPASKQVYGDYKQVTTQNDTWGDSGSAARFFYCAKSSKSERNKGLEGFDEVRVSDGKKTEHHTGHLRTTEKANHHPTVKPVKLMQYLVRLVTPKGGTVLDPFNGSGTTGIACKLEGFDYIGIELDPEYVKISEARIAAWEPEVTEQVALL